MDSSKIVYEIEEYMLKHNSHYKDWYAGIAANPKVRLFSDHAVDPSDPWIICPANNSDQARIAEEKLLNLGCDGGAGGGDTTTTGVYAYLKDSHTNP